MVGISFHKLVYTVKPIVHHCLYPLSEMEETITMQILASFDSLFSPL